MQLPKFLSNPIFGLIGIAVSLAGLFFGIYAYNETKQFRNLRYAIEPERTVLIDSAKASDFEINYKSQKVETDVTSVIITLWNSGKLSIRPENILKPIIISVGNGVNVLEAKILRSSRDIVGFSLDTQNGKDGIIVPKWGILENEDGAVIQLIYAGNPDVPISVEGVIEGKKLIKEFLLKVDFPIPLKVLQIIMGALIMLMVVMKLYSSYRLRESRWSIVNILMWIQIIIILVFVVFFFDNLSNISIPVKI